MQHSYRHYRHAHPQRQPRHGGTMLVVYLAGVVTGIAISLRLVIIALWRSETESIQHRVGLFNKRWTNRLVMTVLRAGQPRSPYALIRHMGRRSGRAYATPVIAVRMPNAFIIPLAYGEKVDWYRNIRAADGCTIEWQGHAYRVGAPAAIPAAQAIPAFPRLWGFELRLYGVTHYLQLPIIAPILPEPIGADLDCD